MFGAGIGQGLSALGEGAQKAVQFQGQVNADHQVNGFGDFMNGIMDGVPGKMVTGPDGTQVPDTGYNGLQGLDKMNRYATLPKDVEAARQEFKSKLDTPISQLQFEEATRRMMQIRMSEAGSGFARATHEFAMTTNNNSAKMSIGDIVRDAGKTENNDVAFKGYLENMKTAYIKNAHNEGSGPQGTSEAIRSAEHDAWHARIASLAVDKPDMALKFLGQDDVKTSLGKDWPALQEVATRRQTELGGLNLSGEAGTAVKNGWRGTQGAQNSRPMIYDPKLQQVVFKDTGLPPTEAEVQASLNTPDNLAKGAPTQAQARAYDAAKPGGIDQSIPPEGRALLSVISGPESAGQYNVRFGGAHFGTYADHPRIHERIPSGPNAGNVSDAAGRYQFLSSTWDTEKAKLGLTDFSPASQDKAAWDLAQTDYEARTGRNLLTDLKSRDPGTMSRVAGALRQTWTSLPGGIEQGQTGSRFENAYNAALSGNGDAGSAAASTAGQPPPSASTPDMPAKPPAQPAAFAPQIPGAPEPPPPPSGEMTPEQVHALQVQYVEQSGRTEQEKKVARQWVDEAYRSAVIAAQATQKEKEEKANDASADYAKRVLLGQVGPSVYQDIANDPRLAGNGPAMERVSEYVNKWSGVELPSHYGKGFVQTRADMLSEPGSPGHISDFQEVYKRSLDPDNPITPAGVNELYQMHQRNQKSIDLRWADLSLQKMLKSGNSYLSFDGQGAIPGVYEGLKDPDGVHASADFEVRYTREYSHLLDDARETHDFKKLDAFLQDKHVKEITEGIRSERKVKEAYMNASSGIGDQPGQALPSAPEGVPEQGWNKLMGLVGPNTQGVVNHGDFARHLQLLASDPEKMAPLWDKSKSNIGAKLSASQALQLMGVNYQPHVSEGAREPPEVKYRTETERENAEAAEHRRTIPFLERTFGGEAGTVRDILERGAIRHFEQPAKEK